MDINHCRQFSQTHTYNDEGVETTLEHLSTDHDPLTILIEEEEQLIQNKRYVSLKDLAEDLRFTIHNEL